MSAHTEGPWHRNIKPARKYAVVFAGRNTHVAVVCSGGLSDAEVEANCDLIASAPELLAALVRAREELCLIRSKDCDRVYDTTLRMDMDAAIAKATGGTA